MLSFEELKTKLSEIEKVTNTQWMSSLDERKRKELEFHDRDRDRSRKESLDDDSYEKFYGNRKYYDGAGLSRLYVDNWIKVKAKDRVFLDYACGDGASAIKAAKAGAKLAIGIDISRLSVENAKRDAEKEGVQANTYFLQADAENTKLPNSSIDVIICSGMLHHLDLSYAFPELRRIMNSGGVLLAGEALSYNPLIKLYRYITPSMRTEWEKRHILSLADVRFAKRFFDIHDIRYWHVASILTPYCRALLPVWNSIDKVLTKIPLIQQLAWIFTFELHRRVD